MQRLLLAATVIVAAACSTGTPGTDSDGTWVGTITTSGDVTTIVNESGSVWGGTATLIEEASIGVESGPEEYMFGRVAGLYAAGDEIFVVDTQVPVVRVFDPAGRHLRNLGRAGQGPGEFEHPEWITGTPDGRVLVMDGGNSRINAYGPTPGELATWPLVNGQCCLHAMATTPAGVLWVEGAITNFESRRYEDAIQAYGPDGAVGRQLPVPRFDYERWTLRFNGREIEAVPFAPSVVWAIHPDGPLVAGASDRYRFEIVSHEGTRLIVERARDPVPVSELERAFAEQLISTRYGRNEGGDDSSLQWDGRVPTVKPAFENFLASYTGEIWALRSGPSRPVANCDPTEMVQSERVRGGRPRKCYTPLWIIDVFDADGRYLGEVEPPPEGYLDPTYTFIRGETVITTFEDQAGTIMVKRYRLVLPGEE